MNEVFQFYQALEAYNLRLEAYLNGDGTSKLNRKGGPLTNKNYYDRVRIPDVPSGMAYLCYVYFPGQEGRFCIELFLRNGINSPLEQRIIDESKRIAKELFALQHEPGPNGGNDCRFRYYSKGYDIMNPIDRGEAIEWLSEHMSKAFDWFSKNRERIFLDQD